MVVGTALQTYGDALESEQEVLSCAADILIETYAGESALSRARQSRAANAAQAGLHESATRVYVHDAAARVEASAKTALAAMADGDSCGRCWRRCAACSSRRRSIPSRCAASWPRP